MTDTEVIIQTYEDYYYFLFEELFAKSEESNDTQKTFANICMDSKYRGVDFSHQKVLYTKVNEEIQKRIAEFLLCGRKSEINFSNLVNDMYEEYWISPEYNKCEVENNFAYFILAGAKKYQALSSLYFYSMLDEWPGLTWPELKRNSDSTQDFIMKIEKISDSCVKQFFNKKEVAAFLINLYSNYQKL